MFQSNEWFRQTNLNQIMGSWRFQILVRVFVTDYIWLEKCNQNTAAAAIEFLFLLFVGRDFPLPLDGWLGHLPKPRPHDARVSCSWCRTVLVTTDVARCSFFLRNVTCRYIPEIKIVYNTKKYFGKNRCVTMETRVTIATNKSQGHWARCIAGKNEVSKVKVADHFKVNKSWIVEILLKQQFVNEAAGNYGDWAS